MSADISLACIETSSIARGVVCLDAIVKHAPVKIRHRGRYSQGKYIILFEGDVASVEEAYGAALEAGADCLIDHMRLPYVHPAITQRLDGVGRKASGDSVLMVELTTVASLICHLDATLKFIDAKLIDLQLAMGIQGKGYFAVEGSLADVEAARDELLVTIDPEIMVALEIIARPHEEMLDALGHGDPFLSYQA